MDPRDTPKRPQKGPGRLRSALAALRGEPVVPGAIRAEWTAWQWELEGLCEKVSLAAKRVYARDKAELDRALARVAELEGDQPFDEGGTAAPSGSRWREKAELNRRYAALQGSTLPAAPTANGAGHVDGVEAE